jgi:hypothetical protein
MARLRAAGRQERLERLGRAAQLLAASLARVAAMVQPVEDSGALRGLVRQVGSALGLARDEETPLARAGRELLARLDGEIRSSTSDLLHLHALEGQAGADEILEQVGAAFDHQARVAPAPAAIVGGLVSGALAGLGADLASGGLTLGGGLIAGSVLGALGAAGLAHGLNLVRGRDGSRLLLQDSALEALLTHALLRYLAIAHFGRGRGEWSGSASPVHWRERIEAALQARRAPLDEAWSERADLPATEARLRALIEALLREVLAALHPAAAVELAVPPRSS